MRCCPRPRRRASAARVRRLTILARALVSGPSPNVGNFSYSSRVSTNPNTESPRNSSRWLWGRGPVDSCETEGWVSASRNSLSSRNACPRVSWRAPRLLTMRGINAREAPLPPLHHSEPDPEEYPRREIQYPPGPLYLLLPAPGSTRVPTVRPRRVAPPQAGSIADPDRGR